MSGDDGIGEDGAVPARPALRVVRGEPSPAELAALVAVLAAAGRPAAAPGPGPRSRWNARTDLVRRPRHPGPGAWRAALGPG